jgi:hypothetical protein
VRVCSGAVLSESAATLLQALTLLAPQSWLRARMEPDQTKPWDDRERGRRRPAAQVAAAQSLDPKGLSVAVALDCG